MLDCNYSCLCVCARTHAHTHTHTHTHTPLDPSCRGLKLARVCPSYSLQVFGGVLLSGRALIAQSRFRYCYLIQTSMIVIFSCSV